MAFAEDTAQIKATRPHMFQAVSTTASPEFRKVMEASGVPVFEDPNRAVNALAALVKIAAGLEEATADARLDGLMVAPMQRGIAECVIGVQRDPSFGPVVMFGLGGVHVEALRDVVFRAAPFHEAEARRMIGELRALRLLTHPRGESPADLDTLARLLSQVSRIAAASPGLSGTDMNPVLAQKDGAVILDALLIG